MNLSEQKSACFDPSCCWRKRREPLSDQIGVHKIFARCVTGQEFLRKGRLPCAVWSCNDVEIRSVFFNIARQCMLLKRQRPPTVEWRAPRTAASVRMMELDDQFITTAETSQWDGRP